MQTIDFYAKQTDSNQNFQSENSDRIGQELEKNGRFQCNENFQSEKKMTELINNQKK